MGHVCKYKVCLSFVLFRMCCQCQKVHKQKELFIGCHFVASHSTLSVDIADGCRVSLHHHVCMCVYICGLLCACDYIYEHMAPCVVSLNRDICSLWLTDPTDTYPCLSTHLTQYLSKEGHSLPYTLLCNRLDMFHHLMKQFCALSQNWGTKVPFTDTLHINLMCTARMDCEEEKLSFPVTVNRIKKNCYQIGFPNSSNFYLLLLEQRQFHTHDAIG